MDPLHGRNHAELGEAWHVDRMQMLRVLDAPAQRPTVTPALRALVEIEDLAIGTVANRMRVQLVPVGSRKLRSALD